MGSPILGEHHEHGAAGDKRGVNAEIVRSAVAALLEFMHALFLLLGLPIRRRAQYAWELFLREALLDRLEHFGAPARSEIARQHFLERTGFSGSLGDVHHR